MFNNNDWKNSDKCAFLHNKSLKIHFFTKILHFEDLSLDSIVKYGISLSSIYLAF